MIVYMWQCSKQKTAVVVPGSTHEYAAIRFTKQSFRGLTIKWCSGGREYGLWMIPLCL